MTKSAPLRAPPRARPLGTLLAKPLGKDGLYASVRGLLRHAVTPTTARKYAGAFESYAYFCHAHDVPSDVLDRVIVAAWLYDKCDLADNAISVQQWRTQLYAHAHYTLGAPKFDALADGPYFKGVDNALRNLYGCTSTSPPALTARILLSAYEAVRPDPFKGLRTWVLWVHLLFAYHLMLRPNEHTGAESELVAGNVTFGTSPTTKVRFVSLRITASKGLRKQQAVGSATEMAITREIKGPLDLYSTLRPTLTSTD